MTQQIKQKLSEIAELLSQYENRNANHHRLKIIIEQAEQAINRIHADELLSQKSGKEYFQGHPTPETEINVIFLEEEPQPKKEIKKPKKNDSTENSWGKI
jgi:uncharacterized phage infection (PIP) family protein YhgE